MKWKFEEEFRLDKPETIGETDRRFDLDNYKDWLEFQLSEARKQLSLFAVSGRSEQLVSFLQWYVKDEAQRQNKELITSIVERYLNETNCH